FPVCDTAAIAASSCRCEQLQLNTHPLGAAGETTHIVKDHMTAGGPRKTLRDFFRRWRAWAGSIRTGPRRDLTPCQAIAERSPAASGGRLSVEAPGPPVCQTVRRATVTIPSPRGLSRSPS